METNAPQKPILKGTWKRVNYGRNIRRPEGYWKTIFVKKGQKFYDGSHCHASIGDLIKDGGIEEFQREQQIKKANGNNPN